LFIIHFIWMEVILPIDELHHFSRWLLHHQPLGSFTRFLELEVHAGWTLRGATLTWWGSSGASSWFKHLQGLLG
jgi:hypothetical protein